MKSLTSYLKSNPAKRDTYVKASYVVLNVGAIAATKLMRHLMEVQDIDPNTQPGERSRKALLKMFEGSHQNSYDADFDFKRFWEKIKGSAQHLNLTKERFRELTDISRLSDEVQELQVTATEVKEGTTPAQADLSAFLSGNEELDEELEKKISNKLSSLDKDSVQAALNVLKKYADQNLPKKTYKEEMMEKAAKAFKSGAFSRVNRDED